MSTTAQRPLLPLPDWATLHYAKAIPHINTLRRWVKDGLIQPQPERHGRAYYVDPEAKYTPPKRKRR